MILKYLYIALYFGCSLLLITFLSVSYNDLKKIINFYDINSCHECEESSQFYDKVVFHLFSLSQVFTLRCMMCTNNSTDAEYIHICIQLNTYKVTVLLQIVTQVIVLLLSTSYSACLLNDTGIYQQKIHMLFIVCDITGEF